MIIKVHSAGKSFKGVVRYLSFDKDRATTSTRLAWTHTLNLANDHVGAAVDEMLWTCRSADQLKREAGISTGGSKLEKPVKHYSLSWHESEKPSREEMIGVAERYLKHLGIEDRQAILFCHTDTRHPHLHIVVNSISPIDGRGIKTAYEHRRTQAFALQYERENGLIFCDERLKARHERGKSPTRPMWQAFKTTEKEFESAEARRVARDFGNFVKSQPGDDISNDWQSLKVQQRHDRQAFIVEGKQRFREVRNTVFRDVRETFRADWKAYFEARRRNWSAGKLDTMKKDILARQNAEFERQKSEAWKDLKESRDAEYDALKKRHIEQKQELRRQHALGRQAVRPMRLDPRAVLDAPKPDTRKPAISRTELEQGFRQAAWQVTRRVKSRAPAKERNGKPFATRPARGPELGKRSLGLGGLGALGAIAEIGERLFDGFFGGGPPSAPPPEQHKPLERAPEFDRENAREQVADQRKAEIADEAARLQQSWDDRRRRRQRGRD